LEENELNKKRNWVVLFIGGASGTGKSTLSYQLAEHYSINVMEIDDIHQIMKAITTAEKFPAIHYWKTGINWMDIGVDGNINWLKNVSKEMIPGIKAIVNRHIDDNVPIILDGDFINPEIILSFNNPKIKTIFINETDKEQLLKNYFEREGGELQNYRADISVKYNEWLINLCKELRIKYFESRPWNTLLNRVIEHLEI
jgi:2-phosphoglycerate kinase